VVQSCQKEEFPDEKEGKQAKAEEKEDIG